MADRDLIPPTPLIRRRLAETVRRASVLRSLLRVAVQADELLHRVPDDRQRRSPEAPRPGGPGNE